MSDTGSPVDSAEPKRDPDENYDAVQKDSGRDGERQDRTVDHDDEQLEEAEENQHGDDNDAEGAGGEGANAGNESDHDSDILSEIDEDQFDDDIEDSRPVEIDEAALKSLKPAKRKEASEAPKKKKKAKDIGRPRKRARSEDDDDLSAVDEDLPDRRPRKARPGREGKGSSRATPQREPEENLTPEERRKRALDRLMDEAIKGPNKRKRKVNELVSPLIHACPGWLRISGC
jgi:transcription factor SPN1